MSNDPTTDPPRDDPDTEDEDSADRQHVDPDSLDGAENSDQIEDVDELGDVDRPDDGDEPTSLEEELGSEVDVEGDLTIDDDAEEDDLLGGLRIDSTGDIEVPDRLVDQVIGQEEAREVVKRAAKQHRHVMMIGAPGTGKSMLAKAMAHLLPKESLQDVLVYHNPEDSNEPKVRTVPAGKGEQIVEAHEEEARKRNQMRSFLMWIIIAIIVGYSLLIAKQPLLGLLAAGVIFFAFRYSNRGNDSMVPKLLINNADRQTAPFEDATGAHAGALLGDVRHDPFQSGGMETPSHNRVEAGAIHKSHKGVLFIDEINTLDIRSQQKLMTA
ncbi:MAG: ATP-binding protein, partial [Halodesulfurarchaeum sp.]